MSDDPLACPFCGELPRMYKDGTRDITCDTRHCPAGYFVGTLERWNTRAQPSDGALTNEVPTGAIVNGAAFMDRIEANYEFRDQHGHPLANCSEWQEARRCFEHLADYAARQPLTNEGAEPVAWRNFDGEGNYDFTDDEETARRWIAHNGPKYHDWCQELFLGPVTTGPVSPRICTCPSGDRSLRWPCPVHPPEPAAGLWNEGSPPYPWDSEWFLAKMVQGPFVVLRPLPEEYTYDFTTADGTYVMRKSIARWAQLSGSEYIAPASTESRS